MTVWKSLNGIAIIGNMSKLENLSNGYPCPGLGSFYNLICKNRFAQLRKTYIDVLRFPNLRDEANWPYFDQMKQILGDSPEELKSPKMSTRAQTKLKMKPKVRARPELRNTVQMALKRRAAVQQKNRLNTRPNNRQAVRPQTTAVKNVMKNVKNNNTEVSELYVALLNLVKKNMKEFGTEKKNLIWDRIEKELKNAGFTWSADSLRGLFHRLRYQYIDIVK